MLSFFLRCVRRRFVVALAFASALGLVTLSAQNIGPNVNLAGGPMRLEIGTSIDVLGDPLRAQQFEDTCTFSSRNPLKIFCIANDHRLVDISGIDATLNTKQVIGDSTLGIFESNNGGLTWQSTIMPGSKYDNVPSPIKPFQAMADGYAGSGAAGVIFASGIAFNRGENARGVVFVSTWIDLNDKEDEGFWAKLVSTKVVDAGTSGQFIDRPFMLVSPPQGAMVTYQVPNSDGSLVSQTVPASPVHLAYTTFVGNDVNIRSKIMYTASYDGGLSWLSPTKVSEGFAVNQGVQIAQVGSKMCLTWRRGEAGGASNEGDAMMVSCSTDGGRSFPKATTLAPLCAADQDTSFTSFRMRAVPALAADASRFYVAFADRPRRADGTCDPNGGSRVYFTSSDGISWTSPAKIADVPNNPYASQINPAIAVSGNQIDVMWYDFRNDASRFFGPVINEYPIVTNPALNPRKRHTVDVYATHAQTGTTQVWAPAYAVSKYISGEIPQSEQHKLKGEPTRQQLQWNAVNVRLFKQLTVPGIGDYNSIAKENVAPLDPVSQPGAWGRAAGQLGDPYVFYSWVDNRNLKLLPNEDYSKPRPYTPPNLPGVVSTGQSIFNPTPGVSRAMCEPGLAGTKNQDIYGALKTGGILAGALGNNKSAATIDRAFAVFGQNMTSDQKILRFAIAVQPTPAATDPAKNATFNQRVGADPNSTFVPITVLDAGALAGAAAVRTVYVPATPPPLQSRYPIRVDVSEVTARSVISITSSGSVATVETLAPHGFVNDTRIIIVGADQEGYNGTHQIATTGDNTFTFAVTAGIPSPATGTVLAGPEAALRLARKVWLNFDPSAPQTLEQPDSVPVSIPTIDEINQAEFYDVEIGQGVVQDIGFPSVKTPGWETPGWETPGWETPGWETPGWETPGWETPGWETPGWETPGWETPGWETSSISDSDVQNGSVRDVRFPVKNKSNSPVAVNLRALVSGALPGSIKLQGVAYRLYTTPGQGCGTADQPTLTGHAQVIFNIPNLDVSAANFGAPLNSSSPQNGTAVLEPGETIYFNVRAWDTTHRGVGANTFNPATLVTAAIRQPLGTAEIENPDITNPPVEASLGVVTSTLPSGVLGVAYSAPLQAVGGTSPYAWTITDGSLPAGLSLNATTGIISGTPEGPVAANGFTVMVTDVSTPTRTASRALSIQIVPPSLTFTVQPSNDNIDRPIDPIVKVTATHNESPVSGLQLTLNIASGPAAAVTGNTATTDASGAASFPNLRVNTAGTFTLGAVVGEAQAATSSSFVISSVGGSVDDPDDDATESTVDPSPDLVSATIARSGASLAFQVSFAAGTFNPATTRASFVLDTDKDRSTGFPGVDAANNDSELVGTEFLVEIGSNYGAGNSTIWRYQNGWSVVTGPAITVGTDSYSVNIPLSFFDNGDGRLNYKVVVQSQVSEIGFTGIVDYMPDLGLLPTVVVDAFVTDFQPVIDGAAVVAGETDNIAQTFEPTFGGTLREIRFAFAASSAVVVEIQAVDATSGRPNGVVLATETVPAAAASGTSSVFRRVVLTTPLTVTGGTRLAIVLRAPAGGLDVTPGPTGDFYLGGNAFIESDGWLNFGNFSETDKDDFPFEVVIEFFIG